MPDTPTYGLPFEVPGDQPGLSLTGGPSGTEDILAEAVETELARIDADVADHETRLTTVEGFGTPSWVKVQSGSVADVASFVIAGIPTGVYRGVRLTLWGQNSTGTLDPIRVRFNGDNTAGLHKWGMLTYDAAGDLDAQTFGDGTFWDTAVWSTLLGNTMVIEIFNTHVSSECTFMAHGGNSGGSVGTHRTSRAWGKLNAARLLDSLRVSGPTGLNFSATWWLEGAPV